MEELAAAREEAGRIFVHKCVQEYMVDIVEATRTGEQVVMGVSPRGNLALLRCAKAYAYLDGRDYVAPDDIKALVLGYGSGGTENAVKWMEQILGNIPVPTEEFRA